MGITLEFDASKIGRAFDKLRKVMSGANICDEFESASKTHFVEKIKEKITKLKIVETGATRNSIDQQLIELNPYNGFTLKIFSKVPYAIYLEKGTGMYAGVSGLTTSGKAVKGGYSAKLMGALSGSSKAKQIPWTYYDERKGAFFKTYGLYPRPFFYPTIFEQQRNFLKAVSSNLRTLLKSAGTA